MSAVMIDAKNVTRNFSISRGMFRGKQILRAVSGVDLTVKKGEVLALVGESGCGKTTLAKIILGLLPQTTGSVDLCGQSIMDLPRLELARLVAAQEAESRRTRNWPLHGSIEQRETFPLLGFSVQLSVDGRKEFGKNPRRRPWQSVFRFP